MLIFNNFWQSLSRTTTIVGRGDCTQLCLELYKVLFTISWHSIDPYNILISICICSCHIYGDSNA